MRIGTFKLILHYTTNSKSETSLSAGYFDIEPTFIRKLIHAI